MCRQTELGPVTVDWNPKTTSEYRLSLCRVIVTEVLLLSHFARCWQTMQTHLPCQRFCSCFSFWPNRLAAVWISCRPLTACVLFECSCTGEILVPSTKCEWSVMDSLFGLPITSAWPVGTWLTTHSPYWLGSRVQAVCFSAESCDLGCPSCS